MTPEITAAISYLIVGFGAGVGLTAMLALSPIGPLESPLQKLWVHRGKPKPNQTEPQSQGTSSE